MSYPKENNHEWVFKCSDKMGCGIDHSEGGLCYCISDTGKGYGLPFGSGAGPGWSYYEGGLPEFDDPLIALLLIS